MTTRRDLLKVASALGITGTVATAHDRAFAFDLLSKGTSERIALDPGRFAADEMYGHLPGTSDTQFHFDWYGSIVPEQYGEYIRATQQLEAYFAGAGIDAFRVFNDYQAAHFNYSEAIYQCGLRHGAAFENLRRAVIGDVVTCQACRSLGATKDGNTCRVCGGTGTVAMCSDPE
jgi:hypothetical protein